MGGSTKAMKTQVLGPIAPNCRETPGGAHGEYRDLMPPPPPEGDRVFTCSPKRHSGAPRGDSPH